MKSHARFMPGGPTAPNQKSKTHHQKAPSAIKLPPEYWFPFPVPIQ
jgi:hypothetical protein